MEEEEDSVQRRKHGSSSKGTLRDGLRGKKKYSERMMQRKYRKNEMSAAVTDLLLSINFGMFL